MIARSYFKDFKLIGQVKKKSHNCESVSPIVVEMDLATDGNENQQDNN